MIYKDMMRREEFDQWCFEHGYSTSNDWNFQTIGDFNYYFIKTYTTSKYALIKHYFGQDRYQVLLHGWTDYNGWD